MPHPSERDFTLPTKYVSADTIRHAFNQRKICELAQSGELKVDIRVNKHLKVPPPGEPYCTRSQFLVYRDLNENYVAGAHQYLRPDGTLGGSGKPDPKWLVVEGMELKYKPVKMPS